MEKSIVVLIERIKRHPIYGKYIKRYTKLHVHDDKNNAKFGDTVSILECGPISKKKSWTLLKIIKKAEN
ncbi:30S ribosomal protein S17 [Candidatus Johnevansia muelleri]|uniref:30S ribosomal protein S17 n=1 Tax=Candidatus Johnevansia muelleri TaxID=1495769 RepID=A0A078KB19_9GAMM|nr:30S ribosomal protein S17 [Candidatus Evansia muelleri]